ncbi:MAG: DUF433 domain-containing protein [Gloeotrichia echinulata GP01]
MNTYQALYTKNIAEYFNFIAPGDIRLQNSRIGIETILYEYIDCGRSAEEIAQIYQSISLEQVYATILYYLQNKKFVSAYMQNWLEHGHRMREQQRLNPAFLTRREGIELGRLNSPKARTSRAK